MTEQRERQLFAEVAECFNKKYKNNMYFAMPEEDIEDAAVELADDISLKIVLGSGRNKKAAVLADRELCYKLKKELGGKVIRKNRLSLYHVWIGINENGKANTIVNEYIAEERAFRRKIEEELAKQN